MNILERAKQAIRPTRPAVEFFGADGSRRDATAELKRCFEDPREVVPSTAPIEFARRVKMAFDKKAPQQGTDEGLLEFARRVKVVFDVPVTADNTQELEPGESSRSHP